MVSPPPVGPPAPTSRRDPSARQQTGGQEQSQHELYYNQHQDPQYQDPFKVNAFQQPSNQYPLSQRPPSDASNFPMQYRQTPEMTAPIASTLPPINISSQDRDDITTSSLPQSSRYNTFDHPRSPLDQYHIRQYSPSTFPSTEVPPFNLYPRNPSTSFDHPTSSASRTGPRHREDFLTDPTRATFDPTTAPASSSNWAGPFGNAEDTASDMRYPPQQQRASIPQFPESSWASKNSNPLAEHNSQVNPIHPPFDLTGGSSSSTIEHGDTRERYADRGAKNASNPLQDSDTLTVSNQGKNSGPAPHTHLKKQQACLTCKRRKTRCDAVRPICGACSRSQARAARGHALTAEVPPGPCTYPDDEQHQHQHQHQQQQQQQQQQPQPQQHQQPQRPQPQRRSVSEHHSRRDTSGPEKELRHAPLIPPAQHRTGILGVSPSESSGSADSAYGPAKRRRVSHAEGSSSIPAVAQMHPPVAGQSSQNSSGSTTPPFSELFSSEGSPGSQNKSYSPRTTRTSVSGQSSSDRGYAHWPYSTSSPMMGHDTSHGTGKEESRPPGGSHRPPQARASNSENKDPDNGPKTKKFIIEVDSGTGGRAKIQRFYKRDPARTATGEPPGMGLHNLMDSAMASNTSAGNPSSGQEPWLDVNSDSMPQVDLMLRELWPDLSPDLPTPDTIQHMAELFFAKHPCRTAFAKDTMLARLKLPPGHVHRPHPALLHAILAAAEPFSPFFPTVKDTDPFSEAQGAEQQQSGGTWAGSYEQRPTTSFIERCEATGRGMQGIASGMDAPRAEISSSKASFGEFHLGKARREIEIAALTQNQRPIEWIQASILIAYCLLDRCRIMELLFFSAAMVRTLSVVGLDKMPNELESDEWNRSILGRPEGSVMHYEQRMCLWHVFLADLYGAGPARWYEPSIADDVNQLTTTMPVLMSDVRDDSEIELSDQTLASPDLFRQGHTDTFMLHVKSAWLLKRVRVLSNRKGIEIRRMARPSAEMLQVDQSAKELLSSFSRRKGHDVDWIVAEASTCIARIILHSHFLNTGTVETDDTLQDANFGVGPIMEMAEMMLRTVHDLLASSFDLNMLHVQTFICWTILARSLETQMRRLSKVTNESPRSQANAAQRKHQALSAIHSIMAAMSKASSRSIRAKTSLDICRTIIDSEVSDDEFSDLVFIWQLIPAV